MRGRRRLVLGGAGLALAVAVVAAAVVLATQAPDRRPAASHPPPAGRLATVPRTDIARPLSLDGTLGYGVERPVKGGSGRVTWLPAAGTVVSRGDPLLRIDDRPVSLFYGTTPLFRPLNAVGLVGRDV